MGATGGNQSHRKKVFCAGNTAAWLKTLFHPMNMRHIGMDTLKEGRRRKMRLTHTA